MKKIISTVTAFCMVLGGTCMAPVEAVEKTLEAYIPSEIAIPANADELLNLIKSCEERKAHAHEMATSGRGLGYDENHPVVELAKKEWDSASAELEKYQLAYDNIKAEWNGKKLEYPTATVIWEYLISLGYNEFVTAGIIGNLMAEVGGQTLDIQYLISGNGYYGICQWGKGYSEVWGRDLNGQLDYLRDTIENELNAFGFCFQKGFKYSDFLSLTNEKSAALAFAKAYERCGSGSYSIRQKNATKAYKYFTE